MASIAPASKFPYYPTGYTGGYTFAQAAPFIAQAESSNNPNAQNPTSTASGLYGITNGTWSDFASGVPGASAFTSARQAPASIQYEVANAAYDARGIEPWATAPSVLSQLDNASAAGILGDVGAPIDSGLTIGENAFDQNFNAAGTTLGNLFNSAENAAVAGSPLLPQPSDATAARIPAGQPGSSQGAQTGWLAAIFDTISSLFGRASFMIIGGAFIVIGAVAAVYGSDKGVGKATKTVLTKGLK